MDLVDLPVLEEATSAQQHVGSRYIARLHRWISRGCLLAFPDTPNYFQNEQHVDLLGLVSNTPPHQEPERGGQESQASPWSLQPALPAIFPEELACEESRQSLEARHAAEAIDV